MAESLSPLSTSGKAVYSDNAVNIANLFYKIACQRYRMTIYWVILLQHESMFI
jgi:hypothetical protein